MCCAVREDGFIRKMVLKGNLLEMMSTWQISIGYEDNQIMTPPRTSSFSVSEAIAAAGSLDSNFF